MDPCPLTVGHMAERPCTLTVLLYGPSSHPPTSSKTLSEPIALQRGEGHICWCSAHEPVLAEHFQVFLGGRTAPGLVRGRGPEGQAFVALQVPKGKLKKGFPWNDGFDRAPVWETPETLKTCGGLLGACFGVLGKPTNSNKFQNVLRRGLGFSDN